MRYSFIFRASAKSFMIYFVAGMLASCAFKTSRQPQNQIITEKYRCSFPSENVSGEFEALLPSVKKITNYSSYRTYVFSENSRVTLQELNSDNLIEHTSASIVTSNATAGTALTIFSDGKHVAMLTCAHAVKAPDTIIEWSEYVDLTKNRYIQSISFKIKQQLYVRDMPEGSKFEVIKSDTKNDIAFIGTSYPEPANGIPVFTFRCGNSSDLRWGNFIYLAGYPAGQLMVTHGLVSTLPEKSGCYLTDAPFNEGFSGGIALSLPEQGDKFEFAGMARSTAGSYSYVLRPEKEIHEFLYNPDLPYIGNLYVEQKKEFNYGVTTVISANQIKEFYIENRQTMQEAGYNLDEFFNINQKK